MAAHQFSLGIPILQIGSGRVPSMVLRMGICPTGDWWDSGGLLAGSNREKNLQFGRWNVLLSGPRKLRAWGGFMRHHFHRMLHWDLPPIGGCGCDIPGIWTWLWIQVKLENPQSLPVYFCSTCQTAPLGSKQASSWPDEREKHPRKHKHWQPARW